MSAAIHFFKPKSWNHFKILEVQIIAVSYSLCYSSSFIPLPNQWNILLCERCCLLLYLNLSHSSFDSAFWILNKISSSDIIWKTGIIFTAAQPVTYIVSIEMFKLWLFFMISIMASVLFDNQCGCWLSSIISWSGFYCWIGHCTPCICCYKNPFF